MDDSIDAESFRNGSVGSGGGQKKTHGVCGQAISQQDSADNSLQSQLSSNASRAASPASTGPRSIPVRPQSSFGSPIRSESRNDDSNPDGRQGSSAPSGASQTSACSTTQLDGASGVLVNPSPMSSRTIQQHLEQFSTPQDNSGASSSKGLRLSMVSHEGSPLPRVMRSARPNTRLKPSPLSRSDVEGHETHSASERESHVADIKQGDGMGWHATTGCEHECACGGSCAMSLNPNMQARCRTATPSPSEIGGGRGIECAKSWEGCEHCCSPWPTNTGDWTNVDRSYRSQEPTEAYAPSVAKPNPATTVGGGWMSDRSPSLSQIYDAAPFRTTAPGLSQLEEAASPSQHTIARSRSNNGITFAHLERRIHKQECKVWAANGEKQTLSDRINTLRATTRDDLITGLDSLEHRIERMLHLVSNNNSEQIMTPQGGSAQSNVASVMAGGHHGCGMNRTDLDLRDLNKQILKMNLYEKVRREQGVIDRLAKIEEKRTTKHIDPSSDETHVVNVHESADLRDGLNQQKHDFNVLKKELQLMPEMRGEIANLSNEALWQRDRINNLENIACEQQRVPQLAAQHSMLEAHDNRNTPVPYAAANSWEPEDFPRSQSASFAACERGGAESNASHDGWGGPPPGRPVYEGQSSRPGSAWVQHGEDCITKAWAQSAWPSRKSGTPSSQRGRGWGSSGQSLYEGGKRDSCYEAWGGQETLYPQSSWANKTLNADDDIGYAARFNGGDGWGSGSLQPSFDGFVYREYTPNQLNRSSWGSAQSRPGSWDTCSRTPIVETVLDEEDDIDPFTSRTQHSASSWGIRQLPASYDQDPHCLDGILQQVRQMGHSRPPGFLQQQASKQYGPSAVRSAPTFWSCSR